MTITLCQFECTAVPGLLLCKACHEPANSTSPPHRTFRRCWAGIPRPGTELMRLLRELKVQPKKGCPCNQRRWQMDEWGIDGCHANRATIIAWMQDGFDLAGLGEKLKAGALALAKGLPLTLDGLLDEAIRRAEAKA